MELSAKNGRISKKTAKKTIIQSQKQWGQRKIGQQKKLINHQKKQISQLETHLTGLQIESNKDKYSLITVTNMLAETTRPNLVKSQVLPYNDIVRKHLTLHKPNQQINNILIDLFMHLLGSNNVLIIGTSVLSLLRRNGMNIRRIMFTDDTTRDIDCIVKSLSIYNSICLNTIKLFGENAVDISNHISYGPCLLMQTGIAEVRKMNITLSNVTISRCSPFFNIIKNLCDANIRNIRYDFVIPSRTDRGLIDKITLFNGQENCTATRLVYCNIYNMKQTLSISKRLYQLSDGPVIYSHGLLALIRCIYTMLKVLGYEDGLNIYGDLIKLHRHPDKDDPEYEQLLHSDTQFKEAAYWNYMSTSQDFVLFDSEITFPTTCIASELFNNDGIKEMIGNSRVSLFDKCLLPAEKCEKYYRNQLRDVDADTESIEATFASELETHGRLIDVCAYCQTDIVPSAPIIVLECTHSFHAVCFFTYFLKHYLVPMTNVYILNYSNTEIMSSAGRCPICRHSDILDWTSIKKVYNPNLNSFWYDIGGDIPNKKLLHDYVQKPGEIFSPIIKFGDEISFADQLISLNNKGIDGYTAKLSS